MKVLVLNGSPKAKSDTMVFTSAFLKGLNCQNEHEIKIVNLIEKKIRPCTGCFECFKSGKGTCVIDDDQNKLLGEYAESQIVIWSFPLYAFGMPGHLKTFLDRTVPLISMKMVETEKGCRHVRGSGVCCRHNVVICGCGFPEYEHNFDGLKVQMDLSFRNLTAIYVPQAPLMNIEAAKPVAVPKAEAFFQAGIEYNDAFSLSPATVEKLQSLMIPKDVYIQAHNSSWD